MNHFRLAYESPDKHLVAGTLMSGTKVFLFDKNLFLPADTPPSTPSGD